MLFCLGVQNPIADEAQVYVFIVAHLVAVTVELDDELFVAAFVAVGLHFLRRFIQKEDDGRGVTGNLRGIGDLAGRGCLTGSDRRDIEILLCLA